MERIKDSQIENVSLHPVVSLHARTGDSVPRGPCAVVPNAFRKPIKYDPASGGLNESHNRETSRRETRPNHRRSAASPQGGPRRGRPSSISLPLRKDAAVEEGLALVEEAHRDLRRWALFRVRAVGEDDALLPSSLVDVMVLSGIARCLLRDFDSEPCLLLPGEEAADVVIVVANL